MKQSFIFSRKDCQVQKVHLFEEHQRQWEVEGGNFAEVFKKFQYWWIPGAKEVKYYHKCPAISSSRLTFLMGFSLCFKPFWEQVFSQENWSITGSRTLIGHLKYLITLHCVWKSQKKSHSILRAKRATFTFLVDKSLSKMPKMVDLASFWKTEACGQTVLPDTGASKVIYRLRSKTFIHKSQVSMKLCKRNWRHS